jgi:acetyl esterase/lipase
LTGFVGNDTDAILLLVSSIIVARKLRNLQTSSDRLLPYAVPSAPPANIFYLDPQNAAFAAAIHGQPHPHELGYIDARKSLETLQECNVAADITVEKLEIPGPDGTSTPVVIFRPENAPSILPMVFYLHGGGWIMGRYVPLVTGRGVFCQ